MYQDFKTLNIQALQKELIGKLFGELFKYAPPNIQNLYDGLNYNKALRTLQNENSLPVEKFFATKTINDNNIKYLQD